MKRKKPNAKPLFYSFFSDKDSIIHNITIRSA